MKRGLQKIMMLAFFALMSFSLSAQLSKVIDESFENGFPPDWTQENLRGNYNWTVESGELTRPSGACDGECRLAFRNPSNQTQHYITRLVSPVLDLSSSKVYQPILCFAFAQDKWADDFDRLKVYYRTDAKADWVLLRSYNEYKPNWQLDTILLPAVTATYQLAFEGNDNLGRGIVLDNIEVRSMPSCEQPYDIEALKIANNNVTIEWNGSFDTQEFHIKVSTAPLSATDLADEEHRADVLDTYVSGELVDYEIGNLTSATRYYCYIRAICAGEKSSWSQEYSFETSNLVELPDTTNFNLPLTPGYCSRYEGWYYGNTTGDACPYVNTNSGISELKQYSFDGTTTLFFATEKTNTSGMGGPIEAGQYAYAATPEIDVQSLATTQVSFRMGYYYRKSEINKIIVGVMTNPVDINTFVPVDTVAPRNMRVYDRHIVSFANYNGDGKYIAFVSNFDKTNYICIDDVVIAERPDCPTAQFDYKVLSATEINIRCADDYGCEVIVADSILDMSNIDDTHVKIRQEYPSASCTVTGLIPWSECYIYVRMKCGDGFGVWSDPQYVLMPQKITSFPYVMDFEIDDPTTYYSPLPYMNANSKLSKGITVLSNATYLPKSSKDNLKSQLSPFELYLYSSQTTPATTTTVVFPENPEMANSRVNFYSINRGSAEKQYYYAGVLTDALDSTTFVPLDTIYPKAGYQRYSVDLTEYAGQGKFFAVKVPYIGVKNSVYIDNLTFELMPQCREPENVVVTPGETSLSLQWDANGATAWNVMVSVDNIVYDSLNSPTYTPEYVYLERTDKPSVVVENLLPNQKQYYCYFQSICNETPGLWTPGVSVKTSCTSVEELPYVMNFDVSDNGDEFLSGERSTFAVPCIFTVVDNHAAVLTRNYSPSLSDEADYVLTGKNALALQKSVEKGFRSYVAYPLVEETDIKKLQISFWMYATNAKHNMEIGVMSDPLDTSTFTTVADIKPIVINQHYEYIVPFFEYEGKGKYIAMRVGDGASEYSLYVDSVVIDTQSSCVKITELRTQSVSDVEAALTWKGYDETKWRLVVSTDKLSEEQLEAATTGSGNIVFADDVSQRPYTVKNLESNTRYYFYVRGICSDTEKGYWSAAGSFRTNCLILDAGTLGVELFDAYGVGIGKYPPCYVVGNVSDNADNTEDDEYIPYCSGGYSYSGATSLMIASTTDNNGAYAITPKLDIDNINRLYVSFQGTASDYAFDFYTHRLVVGVITDIQDMASFTPIDTLEFFADETRYEVRFDGYKGDYDDNFGKHVMFFSEFDKNNIVFIDDVVFDTIPECVSPKVGLKSNATDRCTLSLDGGTAPYTILISKNIVSEEYLDTASVSSEENGVRIQTSATATAEVVGLEPGNDYYVYVKSDCGEDAAWSTVKHITTECDAKVGLPYIDNFDANTSVGMYSNPTCWTSFYDLSNQETQFPYVYADGYIGKSVCIYATSSSATSYLVTPEIDATSIAECQVSFYAKSNTPTDGARRSIVVGVADDISSAQGITSFVPVDTIVLNGSSLYDKYFVSLKPYSGSGKHIVFSTAFDLNHNATSTKPAAGGYYIDEITVESTPACQKPYYFVLTSHSDKSLSFSFKDLSIAGRYEVQYGAKGFEAGTGTSIPITETAFDINGLTSDTEYDVYVRSICSDSDNSTWAFAGTYRTLDMVVQEYPFDCDFENDADAGKFSILSSDNPNKWCIGSATAKDGAKSLYISNDNGTSAQYQTDADGAVSAVSYSWAYIPMKLDEGVYTVGFDWTCAGEKNKDFMRVGFIPTTSSFVGGSPIVRANNGMLNDLNYVSAIYPLNPVGWIEANANTAQSQFYMDAPKVEWLHNQIQIVVPEDKAGYYYMVFYWRNNASKGNNPSAAIDNIIVDKMPCGIARDVKAVDRTDTSVDLEWAAVGDGITKYNVAIYTEEVDIETAGETNRVYSNVATETNCSVTGLAPSTRYYGYIQAVCGENNGCWVEHPIVFDTHCAAIVSNYSCSFDNKDEMYYKSYSSTTQNTRYATPNCYESYHSSLEYTSSYAQYFPYLIQNTATRQYSRSGNYALCFKSSKESNVGGYIVLPIFADDIKNKQVSFWIRVVSNSSKGAIYDDRYLADGYSRSVVVGTMTDPTDTSTFTPIQRVVYPFAEKDFETVDNVAYDPINEAYWRQFTVPLDKAVGKYIVFKNAAQGSAVNNQIYIDDIEVVPLISCKTPYGLKVDNEKSTTASLTFSHYDGNNWEVRVSKIDEDEEQGRIEPITSNSVTLEGLSPSTNYRVQVRQVCDETIGTSEWSGAVHFKTAASVRFSQDFSNEIRCPEDWSRGVSSAPFVSNTTFNPLSATDTKGWVRQGRMSETGKFNSGHMSVKYKGPSTFYWLVSPEVELPAEEKVHATFNLAVTDIEANMPPEQESLEENHRFMVIVSTDGGKTWLEENATVWSNDGLGEYSYSSIPSTGKQYRIDLTKYAGECITLSFYSEMIESSDAIVLHLDDVVINTFESKTITDAICQKEDYNADNFFIVDSLLEPGLNIETYLYSPSDNTPDTVFNLELTVYPFFEKVIEDYVCEGYVYDKNGFNVSAGEGIYRRKLKAKNDCDSIITLKLTEEPSRRVTIKDTICFGNEYPFNGVTYKRTGIYCDTLTSKVTGCDSIVTLWLKVNDAIVSNPKITICHDESYSFGKFENLTQSGTYTDTLKTGSCDSIVNLELTVMPDFRKTIQAIICEGEAYNENGFVGVRKTGQYTLPLESKDGCDSTLTLNLTVLSGDTTRVEFKITTDDLPYTYESITYPEGTKAGTYIDTVNVSTANCDNVIIHTLVIEEKVGVDNVSYRQLTLTPNPVERGNTATVTLELDTYGIDDAVVYVYNTYGALVDSFEPQYEPVTIECSYPSGVYLVRIVDASGRGYQGKLIVQ